MEEIKLLREVQLIINDRTEFLDKQVSAGKLSREKSAAENKALADSEKKIQDMAEEIRSKLPR
ncbi:MAG: hypothetical protein ACE15C_13390 [Phycisphaerae bacterium]